ncbi:MAG: lysophospholipid acyltransferase family protein [Thermoguttaceae bacterium]
MLSSFDIDVLATALLAALGLAVAALGVVRARRSPLTALQAALYGLNYLLTRILWRLEVRGAMPIPAGQGALVICNHRSPVDPSFIQVATGQRVVHWMVAKEYCEHPLLAWFFRATQAIPVSRGGIDTAATKLAIRLAEGGELVALFPEGRINVSEALLMPGRPGVALIALKARVPVVPCYCEGAPYDGTMLGALLMPARVRLVIGPPIDISPYYGRENEREVLDELTLEFLRAIARLAGRPDFEPSLAGRSYKPDRNGE